MFNNVMAGDAEAAGAIAGMQELYGLSLPERGQAIRGITGGKRWSGTCAHSDEFWTIVEIEPEVYVRVPTTDIEIE
jgi:hypothetical protein